MSDRVVMHISSNILDHIFLFRCFLVLARSYNLIYLNNTMFLQSNRALWLESWKGKITNRE